MDVTRKTFWQEIFRQGQNDLIKDMVYSIKAAEAEELLEQGLDQALQYALERADPLDVLVYLKQDGLRAILYYQGEKCQEGDLIDLVLFLEDQPSLDGYSLDIVGLAKVG